MTIQHLKMNNTMICKHIQNKYPSKALCEKKNITIDVYDHDLSYQEENNANHANMSPFFVAKMTKNKIDVINS